MTPRLRFPADIGLDRFIEEYWQRKPLLLRKAIDPAQLQFEADELAGMACEEGIESRLIRQLGDTDWQLQHGPLDEAVFATLPDSHWTLLVQDVDKHVPEVADLLDAVDFLPDWRIDDIMISYATDRGGVGPHTDNYDVFLIQAQGQRRWRISERDHQDADLLPDCPLRVLREFHSSEDWVLEPGDVLYLPPRVGHWGTAVGECMTWSIGMRGPSSHELAQAWIAHRAESEPAGYFQDQLHADRAIGCAITDNEFAAAAELVRSTLPQADRTFRHWFGCHVTEPKPDLEILPPEHTIDAATLRRALADGETLRRHPWARFARIELDADTLALCSQGECHELPRAQAPLLDLVSAQRRIDPQRIEALTGQPGLFDWLALLFNRGLLQFDD